MVACKKKNNLPKEVWFRHVTSFETGTYPEATMYHVSIACNHCENPACIKMCPTAAMHRDEVDATVQHDEEQCIGCGSCVIACPYGVPTLVEELGVAKKCNACIDTRAEDGEPTCVAACGTRALEFGTYEELRAAHPDAVSQTPCMPSKDITNPGILIDGRPCMQEVNFRELIL